MAMRADAVRSRAARHVLDGLVGRVEGVVDVEPLEARDRGRLLDGLDRGDRRRRRRPIAYRSTNCPNSQMPAPYFLIEHPLVVHAVAVSSAVAASASFANISSNMRRVSMCVYTLIGPPSRCGQVSTAIVETRSGKGHVAARRRIRQEW